ncbi:MAG: tetratricopeptide repeat protein [Candidatus Riflebacteria bacterium]|nr:tetratricopeptide repeat protein [Candidatus Riflebacteria bacterium]
MITTSTTGFLRRSSLRAKIIGKIMFALSAMLLFNPSLPAIHGQETTGLQTPTESYEVRFALAEKLMKKGVALGREKKHNESVKALREAIELIPDNATLWYNLGLSLYHSGKHAEALEAWDKTVNIRPDYRDVWHMIGLVRSKNGKSTEAIAAFTRGVETNPDDSDSRASLIRECLNVAKTNMEHLKKTDPAMAKKLTQEFPGDFAAPGAGATNAGEHPLGNTEIPGTGKNFNELLEIFKKIPFQRNTEK